MGAIVLNGGGAHEYALVGAVSLRQEKRHSPLTLSSGSRKIGTRAAAMMSAANQAAGGQLCEEKHRKKDNM